MPDAKALVLSELISLPSIHLNLHGANRDTVLEELVGHVPELRQQPEARQALLRALREREDLFSTGIGDGVALPHARNALVGMVNRPVIVFGRQAQGIPYGAIDGAPARLFFLLVAPNVTQHLGMLARISRLLRDATLRRDLLAAETPAKVLDLIRNAEAKL